MIILLQTGKGADMGAAFGGGSSQTLWSKFYPGTIMKPDTQTGWWIWRR